jgi:hypothetical protein
MSFSCSSGSRMRVLCRLGTRAPCIPG